jgi:hypothetical protein
VRSARTGQVKGPSCLLLFMLLAASAFPCSWASGHFHQVTTLKGKVVGKGLGPLQYMRFLRQRFSVPNAELTLYEFKERAYRQNVSQIATTKADKNGNFAFGPIPPGRYTLAIDSGTYSDWFDVEITKSVKTTESITIDVSPIFPNCQGGHEFIVKASN